MLPIVIVSPVIAAGSEDEEEELSEVLVELSEVLVELSEELPEDEVVLSVLSSSESAHEETITAILTIRTNQEVRLFILFHYIECWRSRIKKSQIQTIQSNIRTKTKY